MLKELETADIVIISGEGTGPGTIERYHGSRTRKAIQDKLSRDRCKGARWAEVWIELSKNTYGMLDKSLSWIDAQRTIRPEDIIDNPAAMLAHRRAKK